VKAWVLPRLASEAQDDDPAGLRASVRWAGDAMVVATMPVAALLTALSAPVMAVLAFGEAAEGDGPELLGAALVGLAIGIPVYGGFLLLTRVAYALGDSRTPAVAAIVVAGLGALGMLAGAAATDGADTLVVIGIAHTGAYALGAAALAVLVRPKVGSVWHVAQLVPTCLAVAVGAVGWFVMERWDPDGRVVTAIAIAAIGAGGLAVYTACLRLLGAIPPSSPVATATAAA
jgi:putative peptidoglycan lipid II flippase